MGRLIRVFPVDVNASDSDLQGWVGDLYVTSIGYEERAVFAAKEYASKSGRRLGIAFKDRRVLSFNENLNWCKDNDFEVIDYDEGVFAEIFGKLLDEIISAKQDVKQVVRLVVDVSSMSRPMIAQTIYSIWTNRGPNGIDIRFVYSLAAFSPPPEETPVTISSPVIPELAGWSDRPDLPASAIVGLGYERDQALATIDTLEPAKTWLFYPEGKDKRYEDALLGNNQTIFELVSEGEATKYLLEDPFDCFCRLESLVFGATQDTRPIIIPFGPKLFTLISILAALSHYPKITVWRVSGEQFGPPVDRAPEGHIFSLAATFMHGNL